MILPAFPGVSPGTIEQVIGVFIQIFDGIGSFTQAKTVVVKGSLSGLFPDQPASGTYSVNEDCTGTFTAIVPGIPAPLVNQFVLQNRGKEFRSVVVSPQSVMTLVTGRKVH